jgi:FkbM family methyltransferase
MIRGPLRSTFNRVAGNVRLIKQLPAVFAGRRVVVTPRAYLRYWTHSLQSIHSDILAVIDRTVRPGDCLWDIGANVGVVTFAAAQRVGTTGAVLSVEPDVDLCSLLHRSRRLARPQEAPIDILPVAVADTVGIARFDVSTHGSTTSALGGYGRFNGVLTTRTVPTVTLDWLTGHFRPPTFLKIDVEGAELLVLRGGSAVLETHRPTILCEVGQDVAVEVGTLLRTHGYLLLDARRVSAGPLGSTDPIPEELLAFPSERPPAQVGTCGDASRPETTAARPC